MNAPYPASVEVCSAWSQGVIHNCWPYLHQRHHCRSVARGAGEWLDESQLVKSIVIENPTFSSKRASKMYHRSIPSLHSPGAISTETSQNSPVYRPEVSESYDKTDWATVRRTLSSRFGKSPSPIMERSSSRSTETLRQQSPESGFDSLVTDSKQNGSLASQNAKLEPIDECQHSHRRSKSVQNVWVTVYIGL